MKSIYRNGRAIFGPAVVKPRRRILTPEEMELIRATQPARRREMQDEQDAHDAHEKGKGK